MPRNARERLISSASTLMQERGYAAVSVDEIVAGAEVSKGAAFYHFGSKEELAVAALDHYFQALRAQIRPTSDNPREAIAEFFESLAQAYERGLLGPNRCLLGVLGQERPESAARLREVVADSFGNWRLALAQRFGAGLPAGSAAEADTLARQSIAVVEGALVMHAADGDTAALAEVLRSYSRLVLHRIPETKE